MAVVGLIGIGTGTAWAQVTGSVTGTVHDSQGGVLPGATVTLTSATRGTSVDVQTNLTGDFQFPNVAADTYSIKVTMTGFKTLERPNVAVSPGDRVTIGTLTIELGALNETVIVSGEAPLIQAQSGERSMTIATEAVSSLPIASRNWRSLIGLLPGMDGEKRMGTPGQGNSTNLMMDGVVVLDTGCNCRILDTMVETIAEVKVVSSGYQAEYGLTSGAQITAVTKSGSNAFHGSVYDVERNSDWNSNSWANQKNGIPKAVNKQRDYGYTIGGPIGKPGGDNTLFFFYGHEFQPRTNAGATRRFRVPTELERAGDFSKSTDNQGNLINALYDAQSGLPRNQCVQGGATAACFQDGGVLGRIPQNRLYGTGLAVLKQWPVLPNAQGLDYNYENIEPEDKRLGHQATVRLDWQASSQLRVMGKYSGQYASKKVLRGSIPGFNDTKDSRPDFWTPSVTVNYSVNPTTFVEVTYGYIQNTLGRPHINEATNRCNIGLCDFPLLFPDAGVIDPNIYNYEVLAEISAPMLQNNRIMLPPTFSWGNRIGNSPPNLQYPSTNLGVININQTHNLIGSVTKLVGKHTYKAGVFWYSAYKAQNNGNGFQGDLNFGNDSNNPLDTGFGYANAAIGAFTSFSQRSAFVQGAHRFKNVEAYIQDNWRVTSRLTLDYGVRFTHQQPQHDTLTDQLSNWFVDRWSAANAPTLYVPGCAIVQNPCAAANRVAVDRRTGVSLGPNTSTAIATLVPNSGDTINGIVRAGQGIAKENYTWPALVVGPRVGAAYDISGNQNIVLRGSFGMFYDRPQGDTTAGQSGNPPHSTTTTVRYGLLQNLGSSGLQTQAPPSLTIYKYDSKIPTNLQWNAGVQMALPWASTLDVSYVASHGYNLLNQSGSAIDLNAPDFGAAWLPQNQDPTLARTTNGSSAYTTDLLRPYQGFGAINQQWGRFWNRFHSIQTSLDRRFTKGLAFNANYTLTLDQRDTNDIGSDVGLRLIHNADGTYSDDPSWAAAEKLLSGGGMRRHAVKGNFTWDPPELWSGATGARKLVGLVVNDWLVSGVMTAGSGGSYQIGYSYQSGGSNVNLTGSPRYAARTVIVPGVDMGSGCSDNQYSQFNSNAFAGPVQGSTGLESGAGYLRGCSTRTFDLTLQRNFRLGGGRTFQIRGSAFNLFNMVVFSGRSTTMTLVSPTNQTLVNSQFLADGTLNPARLKPQDAGFGAVTGAQAMRVIHMQVRFGF
jgi:hypothetical protein